MRELAERDGREPWDLREICAPDWSWPSTIAVRAKNPARTTNISIGLLCWLSSFFSATGLYSGQQSDSHHFPVQKIKLEETSVRARSSRPRIFSAAPSGSNSSRKKKCTFLCLVIGLSTWSVMMEAVIS